MNTTFKWTGATERELLQRLSAENSATTKKRVAAYERISPREIGSFRKTNVIVPEGKTLSLPLLLATAGVTIMEFAVKPYATLQLSCLQDLKNDESGMTIFKIILERGATLETFAGMFGGASASLFLETTLDGEGSSVHERTLFFGDDTQVFDMFSTTTLRGENTRAVIESKGILIDSAQARFDGSIIIKEGAKKSNAQLLEHTLLLSPEAKMNAIPGLTIETNDVFATHSASMTRVDDEQLFYCKSRGIEEREAIRLIAEGFLSTIYADSPEKERIYTLIQNKLCKL